MSTNTAAPSPATTARRLGVKADTAAAERLLKRAVTRTIAAIRSGAPPAEYVTTLTVAGVAADLLLEG